MRSRFLTHSLPEQRMRRCILVHSSSNQIPTRFRLQAALFDSICQDLPGDWQCPVCGADKKTFQTRAVTVAGASNHRFQSSMMTVGLTPIPD